MTIPTDLRYSTDHEWLRIEGNVATVGVTAFAADLLGDIVFVGLPMAGERVLGGKVCGEIESTKSVSDLVAPVDGEVVEVNNDILDAPDIINVEPYGAGWLFRLRLHGPTVGLMDSGAYSIFIGA